ncbi:MAG TPA: type II toxin-antitoxin system VapC family toxin [Vicinamibacterales bacterium]|nr:type II toxin-antitoxin system VapC family toxin [Vicinamibacterales bacterium]
MIHLDTSALVAALTADRPAAPVLRGLLVQRMRLGVSSLVLYEWWRGPRVKRELDYQELLLPRAAACGFGLEEAALAADLYRRMGRPRRRTMDIAIAACALTHDAELWTLNPGDFRDIPGLTLVT